MTTDTVKKVDTEKVTEKLKRELNVKSERALSIALGLSQSTYLNALNRESLPYEGIVKACIEKKISLDYIFGLPSSSANETVQLNSLQIDPRPSIDVKEHILGIDSLVEDVLDEVVSNTELPVERLLSIRKSLRPILIEAAVEYQSDIAIVTAIARSSLRLV